MAVLKCKMCGGALEISDGATTAECAYCGTFQTLPRIDTDKKANLYGRANHFRRNNEFDKASGIFEQLLEEDATDAEAYWSLVLCKYGIEYVEDPATHKRKPTVNRTQPVSVYADENYKSAIKYAGPMQKPVYEQEAREIDDIQKQIIDISSKETPFDVFICYKETGSDGNRTRDSVLANEIYHQLTQENLKVFFARITLESKLGTAYEPYIFAALNSAKVMIVLGTKAEYFNAVWVKNEWSRYLAMIKSGADKVLIPAYCEMDPYDLPEELSYLQAQDMSRLGFMQDLIRGVKKILSANDEKATQTTATNISATAVNTDSLLKRAFMFLEDGEWQSADQYCEKVLDIDPECAEAYLGKLMVELNVCKRAKLADLPKPFDSSNNYKKVIRFADDKLKAEIKGYIKQISNGIEEKARNFKKLTEIRKRNKPAARLLKIGDYDLTLGLKSSGKVVAMTALSNILSSDGNSKLDYYWGRCDVSDWRDVIALSATKNQTFGLKCDGTVVSTKYTGDVNHIGYYGDCDVSDWRDIVAISSGDYHTVGLKSDGTVVSTKYVGNKYKYCGQCEVSGWRDVVKILAITDNTIGLKSDGTVVAAGTNYAGQCDVSDWRNIVAIFAGDSHTIGLKANGTVVATKYTYEDSDDDLDDDDLDDDDFDDDDDMFETRDPHIEDDISGWRDIVAISVGKSHTVGLKSDGTVVSTRYTGSKDDYHGQCEVSGWRDIVAVSAGDDHTIGLKSDGTVVATKYTGKYYSYQCDVSDWRDIVAIIAYRQRTVGLKSDGSVVATKSLTVKKFYNTGGDISDWQLFEDLDMLEFELETNIALNKEKARLEEQKAAEEKTRLVKEKYTELEAVRKRNAPAVSLLAVGTYHTVGLKSDGTVVATGSNAHGQCDVSAWSDIVAVYAASSYTMGLKSDGTVVAVGSKDNGQNNVSGWRDIVAIAAGDQHTVGLKSNGTAVAVGKNEYGQCGVSSWHNIIAVSAGSDHTIGLKSDGTMVAAGGNKYGQCDVSDWHDIVAISAGDKYTVGLKSDGTVVKVGSILYLNITPNWHDIVAVSRGNQYTVGLKSDGTVLDVVDLSDLDYQSEVSDWRDIVAVLAGTGYTVGLKSDGTVVATKFIGNSYFNQCEVAGWRLFNSIDTLKDERNAATAFHERQKRLAEHKAADESRIAAERASRRNAGVCQYCGGTLKGIFGKKCVNCGKKKDY